MFISIFLDAPLLPKDVTILLSAVALTGINIVNVVRRRSGNVFLAFSVYTHLVCFMEWQGRP